MSFLTESFEHDICFLTNTKLHQLHYQFKHLSIKRLQKLLTHTGHNINTKALTQISKFCHYYQIYSKSSRQFHFTLQDDVNFNYSIIIDIMYINDKPVLHIVDKAICFNATY